MTKTSLETQNTPPKKKHENSGHANNLESVNLFLQISQL